MDMDWINFICTILGALLALAGSILERKYSQYENKKGDLIIFYKKTNTPLSNKLGWGFDSDCLFVPLYVDFVNTTNVNKVVRDFSLYLYNNDRKIKRLVQAASIDGKEEKKFGVTKSRYSFLIEPKSVLSVDCMYLLKRSDIKTDEHFNRIMACYCDENDHKITCELAKIVFNNWTNDLFDIDEEWLRLS